MAANIEIRMVNGVETASYIENGAKERAWHGLGTVYDRPLTVKEALEGAHANFNVELQPVIGVTPQLDAVLNGIPVIGNDDYLSLDGKQYVDVNALREMIVKGKKATMRTDYNETLGIVGDGYGVVQNSQAFDFIDMLTTGTLGGDTPTIECAGMLGRGERVFITAKFPEPIRIAAKDDTIDMYAIFTTSHNGSEAVSCLISPVRVVCQNTLNWAMHNNTGRINYRHTRNVAQRLDLTNKENARLATQTLGVYNTYKEFFEQSLEQLAKVRLTDKETENILAKTLLSSDNYELYANNNFSMNCDDMPTRSKNIITNVTEALHTGIGQDILEKGNGLWLVNGLTTYYQNNFGWKDDEKKFNAITDGSVQQKLQGAFNLIMSKKTA